MTAPNTETMIVDPVSEEPLGIGDDGEVWVRGPQVMAGYLNNAKATADTIDNDGWLHTGDIGHIDEDGHLYIVDRLKELIKYKGFQVAPAELEALLLTHPACRRRRGHRAARRRGGRDPGRVRRAEARPARVTEADIKAFVADQVATYKQLREVHFIDAVPKSPSGKILRRVLRDQT